MQLFTLKLKVLRILDLAVIISGDPEDHCIIHVPTLTFFDNAIPDGEWNLDQLCLWAWKAQQEQYPGDVGFPLWEMISTYSNKTYKNIPENVLNILRQHCLSIKVE